MKEKIPLPDIGMGSLWLAISVGYWYVTKTLFDVYILDRYRMKKWHNEIMNYLSGK